MAVEFKNNSSVVISDLADGISGFLYETGGELRSQIQRNSRVDTGQTKGSYEYKVDESVLTRQGTVYVGSNLENAIWEEYGTGEYAVNGDGRKGGWVYEDYNGVFHYTKGKSPNRPMANAFNSSVSKIKKQLQTVLKKL